VLLLKTELDACAATLELLKEEATTEELEALELLAEEETTIRELEAWTGVTELLEGEDGAIDELDD